MSAKTDLRDIFALIACVSAAVSDRILSFACVSFARIRKKKNCPASEPYPNRWTHHLLISDAGEIDDELMTWIKSAADFSEKK